MDYKPLLIRFDKKTYDKLRDLAHIHRINMADIVRTSVDKLFERNEKELTKRDIGI